MKIEFSLYNDQTTEDLFVIFREKYGLKLSEKVIKKMSKEFHDKFFEIKFDVEVDASGEIKKINLKN